MFDMVDLGFHITYLMNIMFIPVTYLTVTKICLVYTANCCSNLTNIVINTILAGIHCIFWFIYNTKNSK